MLDFFFFFFQTPLQNTNSQVVAPHRTAPVTGITQPSLCLPSSQGCAPVRAQPQAGPTARFGTHKLLWECLKGGVQDPGESCKELKAGNWQETERNRQGSECLPAKCSCTFLSSSRLCWDFATSTWVEKKLTGRSISFTKKRLWNVFAHTAWRTLLTKRKATKYSLFAKVFIKTLKLKKKKKVKGK